MSTANTLIFMTIPLVLILAFFISIIVVLIIGIKKLFAYLDAKTEYYKNKKD